MFSNIVVALWIEPGVLLVVMVLLQSVNAWWDPLGPAKGGEPLNIMHQFCAVRVRKLHNFPVFINSIYASSLTFTFSSKWSLPCLNSRCMWVFSFLWLCVQRSCMSYERPLWVQAELIETLILKYGGLILIMCGKSSMSWGPLVIWVCKWPGRLVFLPKNFLSRSYINGRSNF